MHFVMATEAQNEKDARIYGQPTVVTQLDLEFGIGQMVTKDIPLIEIHIKKEQQGSLTDNLIAMGTTGLVFNSKLRDIFKELKVDNIQYFDAAVIDDASGEVNNDYKVANIIGAVDCIDEDKSELEFRDTGTIRFIDKLVLNESEIKGVSLFRLIKFLPIVIIDEYIKDALVQHKVSGINIYLPEDYVL